MTQGLTMNVKGLKVRTTLYDLRLALGVKGLKAGTTCMTED